MCIYICICVLCMLSVINVGVVGRCSVCARVFLFRATLCKVAQIKPSGQELSCTGICVSLGIVTGCV